MVGAHCLVIKKSVLSEPEPEPEPSVNFQMAASDMAHVHCGSVADSFLEARFSPHSRS